jgi:hypothetical protein
LDKAFHFRLPKQSEMFKLGFTQKGRRMESPYTVLVWACHGGGILFPLLAADIKLSKIHKAWLLEQKDGLPFSQDLPGLPAPFPRPYLFAE